MDNRFPYHGSEHAKIAGKFAKESMATAPRQGDENGDLEEAMMYCHDSGYVNAATIQGYDAVEKITEEAKEGPKLGEGHEKESILIAFDKGLVDPKALYGISSTYMGDPAAGDLSKAAAQAAKLVNAAVVIEPVTASSNKFKLLAEAADFAYMATGYGDVPDNGGGYVCHLLACFLEFFEYGGVEKNIVGAKNGLLGNVKKEWASFMAMQVGFSYFVVTDKLTAAGAEPLFENKIVVEEVEVGASLKQQGYKMPDFFPDDKCLPMFSTDPINYPDRKCIPNPHPVDELREQLDVMEPVPAPCLKVMLEGVVGLDGVVAPPKQKTEKCSADASLAWLRVGAKLAAWSIPMTTEKTTLCDLINEVQSEAKQPGAASQMCMEKHAGINAMGC